MLGVLEEEARFSHLVLRGGGFPLTPVPTLPRGKERRCFHLVLQSGGPFTLCLHSCGGRRESASASRRPLRRKGDV